jgi:exosortase C (VPDSG-CTERM-specific)
MIPAEFRASAKQWSFCTGLLVLGFSLTLIDWVRHCLEVDLFSYALLVPAISAWLIWQVRSELRFEHRPAVGVAAVLIGLAVIAMIGSFLAPATEEAAANRLSLRMLSFVLGWVGLSVGVLGGRLMGQVAFPTAFLLFMVPLPPAMVEGIEVGLQHASAEVSGWFFSWTGASYLRMGLVFQLPNITLEVAPECSGIRSTLVLFMTSLIAGHLFLERNWQRILFAVFVIPLGIARNAFRIVTIGWLCTEYGPEMIHSPIHHRGGPVFFALSLVPLFGMLFLFRWLNRRSRREQSADAGAAAESTPAIASNQ